MDIAVGPSEGIGVPHFPSANEVYSLPPVHRGRVGLSLPFDALEPRFATSRFDALERSEASIEMDEPYLVRSPSQSSTSTVTGGGRMAIPSYLILNPELQVQSYHSKKSKSDKVCLSISVGN